MLVMFGFAREVCAMLRDKTAFMKQNAWLSNDVILRYTFAIQYISLILSAWMLTVCRTPSKRLRYSILPLTVAVTSRLCYIIP